MNAASHLFDSKSDVTYSKDTTLTKVQNVYHNLTIESGITVTTKYYTPDPQGVEISGTLTVKSGGKITGGAICRAKATGNARGFRSAIRQPPVLPAAAFFL